MTTPAQALRNAVSNGGSAPLAPLVAMGMAATAWGLVPVGARYLLENLTPDGILGTRFLLSGLLSIPLIFITKAHRWPRTAILKALALTALGMIAYQVAIIHALQWTSASHAGIILGLQPVIILTMESLFLRKFPRGRLIGAVVLGIIGVVLVVGAGGTASNQSLGDLLALLGAMSWSFYVVASRALSSKFGSAALSSITSLSAGLTLGLVYSGDIAPTVARATRMDTVVILAIVLIASLAAFMAWNWGVSRTTSSQAGVFLYLIPLFSVLGGATLLHERVSASEVAGAAFIIAALAVSQRSAQPLVVAEPSA